MTYPPLAHLPRSIMRQRSLQNGYSGSLCRTILRQVGQRRLRTDFFAIKHRSVQSWRPSMLLHRGSASFLVRQTLNQTIRATKS